MRGKIEDLFVLEQPTNQLCFKTDALYKRLISAAEFFGFTYLPDELRIQMKKCDKNEFNNKRIFLTISSFSDLSEKISKTIYQILK